jgi:spore coat protein U-like protein
MKILTLIIMSELFCLLVFALPAAAFTCRVNATGLNFGSYDVFSTIPKDATSTITVTCKAPPQNPNTPIPVTISLTPGTSGSFAQRQLQRVGGPDQLAYNLFTTPSFSTVWGDGRGSSQTQTNSITTATPWNATLYGRIPARQNISAGSYSDIITVTIDW